MRAEYKPVILAAAKELGRAAKLLRRYFDGRSAYPPIPGRVVYGVVFAVFDSDYFQTKSGRPRRNNQRF